MIPVVTVSGGGDSGRLSSIIQRAAAVRTDTRLYFQTLRLDIP